ncbi:putative mannose-6-phosphate isomerase GmuF [Polystyrenella longa]|uniref:Putative mannose-6-phosphate isomerase GmuF n=1 Tax=Polystyrenella longa TaxID=2528007 RepID=A0A518CPY4_9PLAN|nr:type I phosphomannose isomerase catalytic subunit [Polystyrenella longa]QDU81291.1 putative mannose-6-phosphate isomerase GmuF [Polystyrenella longa]
MPFFEQNSSDSQYSKQVAPLQLTEKHPPLQPLLFNPLLKRICWGGTRLGERLGKPVDSHTDYAESWEISDLPDARSEVACGPHAGWTIADLRTSYKEQLLGTNSPYATFPLLIKFLDIHDKLSVQVHPDDHLALLLTGGNGKTETWVVLECEPDSLLYAGLKAGVKREEFEAALETGNVIDCLHSFRVNAGDAVHLPAGTVHAVRGSILLAEVQQSSDLSFRFHDWDREEEGKEARELHVEEGLICTNFDQGPVMPLDPIVVQSGEHTEETIIDCPHYAIHRHQTRIPVAFTQSNRFRVLVALNGTGSLESTDFKEKIEPGQTWLIPACCQEVTVTPMSDQITFLNVFID